MKSFDIRRPAQLFRIQFQETLRNTIRKSA